MNAKAEIEYPELLADLARIVSEVLRKNGRSNDDSDRIALEAAEAVRRDWGGGLMYIPKGVQFTLAQRDLEIWNDFRGDNVRELAHKYHLSDKQIYSVIAKVRAVHVRRTQPDMFADPE